MKKWRDEFDRRFKIDDENASIDCPICGHDHSTGYEDPNKLKQFISKVQQDTIDEIKDFVRGYLRSGGHSQHMINEILMHLEEMGKK